MSQRPEISRIELAVVARGAARLSLSELAAIRQQAPSHFSARLSPQLLKYSDEQTLASLAAVSNAIECFEAKQDFDAWCVVSSSRYLGRAVMAGVIDKYREKGPWGVSVQVIPHCTPHAVSGTISMAIEAHGPCIGAGGGPRGDGDALLSVAGLLNTRPMHRGRWAGAWLVFSSWSPELVVDVSGRPVSESKCLAVALAVVPTAASRSLGTIGIDSLGADSSDSSPVTEDEYPSAGLAEFFVEGADPFAVWRSSVGGGMQVEVDLSGPPRKKGRHRLRMNESHSLASIAATPLISRRARSVSSSR